MSIEKFIRKQYTELENKQIDIYLNSIEGIKNNIHLNLLSAVMFICLSDRKKNSILKAINKIKEIQKEC